METTIQISEVNSKDVTTQYGTKTVYNVTSSDGKEFSTFKAPLGQAAGQLRGQWATVEYQEVQKGKYTNYYLDSVKPAEAITEAPGGTSTGGVSTAVAAELVKAGAVSHNITYKDDKSAQINRSVAFKAAVELTASGFVYHDGLDGLNKLTNDLIQIVEGTYAPFVPAVSNQSSGEPGDIVDKAGNLVDF